MKQAFTTLGLALFLASAAAAAAPAAPAAPKAPAVQAQGLQKIDTVVGKGKEAVSGKTVVVHYTGWLYEPKAPKQRGKQFDSSVGGEPFNFPLGMGAVIKGWDQGVAGMKVGGKRTLVIPAELGYGARGAGPIPPGATLLFDVELLDVK
jgi:FKBP-type peptidyl-prolyl cis-trans isomerase FkpA